MQTDIKRVSSDFSVSAQITEEDVHELARLGVKSLICNRPDGEAADQPNVSEIESAAAQAGMALAYLPVVSGNFSAADIADFLGALHRLPAPTHAYCRTGTRSITLWSLAQRQCCAGGRIRVSRTFGDLGHHASLANSARNC